MTSKWFLRNTYLISSFLFLEAALLLRVVHFFDMRGRCFLIKRPVAAAKIGVSSTPLLLKTRLLGVFFFNLKDIRVDKVETRAPYLRSQLPQQPSCRLVLGIERGSLTRSFRVANLLGDKLGEIIKRKECGMPNLSERTYSNETSVRMSYIYKFTCFNL